MPVSAASPVGNKKPSGGHRRGKVTNSLPSRWAGNGNDDGDHGRFGAVVAGVKRFPGEVHEYGGRKAERGPPVKVDVDGSAFPGGRRAPVFRRPGRPRPPG